MKQHFALGGSQFLAEALIVLTKALRLVLFFQWESLRVQTVSVSLVFALACGISKQPPLTTVPISGFAFARYHFFTSRLFYYYRFTWIAPNLPLARIKAGWSWRDGLFLYLLSLLQKGVLGSRMDLTEEDTYDL